MTANAPICLAPAMEGTVASRVSYSRLIRLIQLGEVRGARRGKHWLVDLADLARWKREHDPEPVPAA
jgi:hypothetical protein